MCSKPTEYVVSLTNGKDLNLLLEDAKDWAHVGLCIFGQKRFQCHGLAFRTPEHKDKSDVCQIAPFALLPTPFPRDLFEQAVKVQEVLDLNFSNSKIQAMNLLYFRISWDYDFLIKSHEAVIKTDEFTRKMVEILTHVHNEG